MTRYDEMTWCDGCGVEITWGPVMVDSHTYCCPECSQGIPCRCGERMELDDEKRGVGRTSTSTIIGYMV